MSAHIEEQHLYTATCPVCPWWGSETTSLDEAETEAINHDREQHRGNAD